MGISAILAALKTRVGATDAQWFVGADKLQQHDAPPRYVWIPRKGKYAGASRVGGNPRTLVDRLITLECHVWGASLDATEALLEALVAAVVLEAQGAVQIEGEDWERAATLHRGALVVVGFAFRVPVLSSALASAVIPQTTVTTQDHVGTFIPQQGAGAGGPGEECC